MISGGAPSSSDEISMTSRSASVAGAGAGATGAGAGAGAGAASAGVEEAAAGTDAGTVAGTSAGKLRLLAQLGLNNLACAARLLWPPPPPPPTSPHSPPAATRVAETCAVSSSCAPSPRLGEIRRARRGSWGRSWPRPPRRLEELICLLGVDAFLHRNDLRGRRH